MCPHNCVKKSLDSRSSAIERRQQRVQLRWNPFGTDEIYFRFTKVISSLIAKPSTNKTRFLTSMIRYQDRLTSSWITWQKYSFRHSLRCLCSSCNYNTQKQNLDKHTGFHTWTTKRNECDFPDCDDKFSRTDTLGAFLNRSMVSQILCTFHLFTIRGRIFPQTFIIIMNGYECQTT